MEQVQIEKALARQASFISSFLGYDPEDIAKLYAWFMGHSDEWPEEIIQERLNS